MLADSTDPTRIALRPGVWVKRKDTTWSPSDPFT
jgi:hypothetical protein